MEAGLLVDAWNQVPNAANAGVVAGQSSSRIGDAFLNAKEQVPASFFEPDFDQLLPDMLVGVMSEPRNEAVHERIDELVKQLEAVEYQLLQEVSSRTPALFEAAGRSTCRHPV